MVLHEDGEFRSCAGIPVQCSWNHFDSFFFFNLSFHFVLFFFILAVPAACRSFQARDQTHATAATQATAMTTLDPLTATLSRNSWNHLTVLITHLMRQMSLLGRSLKVTVVDTVGVQPKSRFYVGAISQLLRVCC